MQNTLRKYYGFLTILCVFIGFLFPQLAELSWLVPYFLAVLVFSLVIEHRISDFTRVVRRPRTILLLSLSNFLIFPLVGVITGYLLALPPGEIFTGVILLTFAPSPVVAALWSELSGGDGSISITTALFTMILGIMIYPLILFVLGISSPNISFKIFQLLTLSIFVPAAVALFLRFEGEKYIPAKKIMTMISSFISLFIVVMAVAHMASRVMSNEVDILLKIGLLVTILILCGFLYGYLLGKFKKVISMDKPALIYTSGMRDGIIPLSVALLYFSTYATLPATLLLIIMPFLVVGVYYVIKT
ncbi:MAG TPA: hypothetical protein VK444_02730 [Methanobacteriaceae archaeon]|nr:hypothetical protein [Methanobacteriaceae archaeon]